MVTDRPETPHRTKHCQNQQLHWRDDENGQYGSSSIVMIVSVSIRLALLLSTSSLGTAIETYVRNGKRVILGLGVSSLPQLLAHLLIK